MFGLMERACKARLLGVSNLYDLNIAFCQLLWNVLKQRQLIIEEIDCRNKHLSFNCHINISVSTLYSNTKISFWKEIFVLSNHFHLVDLQIQEQRLFPSMMLGCLSFYHKWHNQIFSKQLELKYTCQNELVYELYNPKFHIYTKN